MRLLKFALALLITLYVAALTALWQFQRQLMYFPKPPQIAPEAAGFPGLQTVTLTTSDNQRLIAWYRPPASGQPLILYFHGNANNLAQDAARLNALAGTDFGLFAVDYRGYGGSTGSPDEPGLLRDAEAAYAKVAELGTAPENLILYGHSLGSGLAVAMAARHKARALVLEAPYSSTADVAAARYWMFPVHALMQDQFRADLWIKDVHIPLLVLHGEDDRTIPIEFGRQLYSLANQPKQLLTLPGAGHLLLLHAGVAARVRKFMTMTVEKSPEQ